MEGENVEMRYQFNELFAQSRWLYGPEYDSIEYVFTEQMKTVAENILSHYCNREGIYHGELTPYLISGPDSTFCIYGIEDMSQNGGQCSFKKLLVIELKDKGLKITREDRNRACNYVEDLMNSSLGESGNVTAYIVGDTVDSNSESPIKIGERGRVNVTSYSNLIDDAERRLLALKSKFLLG